MPSLAQATGLERPRVEQVVREVLRNRLPAPATTAPTTTATTGATSVPAPRAVRGRQPDGGPNPLVVNVSARHVHVTPADLETLFGPGSHLTKLKDLYQDGEFASEQTVNLIGPRNRMIPNVRILGPTRRYTQVELSYTDGVFLGIDLPLRISGNHEGTPGGILVGPAGAVNLPRGVIRAQRHVHMHPSDAAHYGVGDGEHMRLRIDGPCGLTFDQLRVRVDEKVKLEVHIDTDEGNACDLPSATGMSLERSG
ncbi:MAG: phosphate propanoyltransferase [Phycisphaeraceae bacterium]